MIQRAEDYFGEPIKIQSASDYFGQAPAPAPSNYALKDVPLAALKNTPESLANIVKGIGQAVVHPVDTATALTKTAAGGVEKLIPESLLPAGRTNEKYFDALSGFMKQRYGGYENLKKTMAEDPAGFMADLSSVVGGGGAGLKVAGLPGMAEKAAIASKYTNPISAGLKGVELAGKGISKGANFAVGLTTGKGQGTYPEIFNAAKQGGEVQQNMVSALRGKTGNAEIANDLRDAFAALKQQRGQEYGNKLARIEKSTQGTLLDTTPLDSKISEVSKNFRIKNITVDPETGARNFEGLSTLTPADKAEFGKMLDIIDAWKAHPEGKTVLGLDALKQQLDNFYTPNSRIGAVATGLKKSVRDILETNVPEYKDMTSGYNKATNMLGDLNNALSIGKRQNTQTIVQKIGTTMREDSSFRRDLIKSAQEISGKKSLLPEMAGSSSSAWLPTGLVGRSMGAGEMAAIATGNFSPGLVPLMLMASPRIVGEGANLAGTIARHGSKLKPGFTPAQGLGAYQAGNLADYLRMLEENK